MGIVRRPAKLQLVPRVVVRRPRQRTDFLEQGEDRVVGLQLSRQSVRLVGRPLNDAPVRKPTRRRCARKLSLRLHEGGVQPPGPCDVDRGIGALPRPGLWRDGTSSRS
ncbi:hypothetical protein GSI_08911 [Ganoderma sinense ZZ0214-1]|uniref:Uncharacterized protein n=1 Tax=Ganoderma sinense ZZ0214-1 TaxID=1077348 RepID=A0A2G8S543_9APHY|nr:hypothetical protein GSI_08911 [Ganoderma sinense ZZ0214-1]